MVDQNTQLGLELIWFDLDVTENMVKYREFYAVGDACFPIMSWTYKLGFLFLNKSIAPYHLIW